MVCPVKAISKIPGVHQDVIDAEVMARELAENED